MSNQRTTLKWGLFVSVVISITVFYYFDWFRGPPITYTATKQNQEYYMLEEHTYGVIGILSADKNLVLRDKHRKFLSEFKLNNVLVRFLLDSPTNETLKESNENSDVIFLNSSYSGRTVRFGEKLSKWLNISNEIFPDAQFVAKMDDGVYICDYSLKIIWENWSSLMYLGWAFGSAGKTKSKLKRTMYEMFVVLGKELVKRIANRRYCYDLDICDNTRDLYDTDNGGTSLAVWLSIYDDVKSVEINPYVIHNKTFKMEQGMCSRYFLLHHIKSHVILEKVYEEQIAMRREDLSSTGVTGSVFDGRKRRVYLDKSINSTIKVFNWRDNITCTFWGVLTTIHSFNTGIEKVSNEMCLVIVADTKTPKRTYTKISSANFVKFLSVIEQEMLLIRGLEIMPHIPWNHFGRKNVGYIYAILHGAKSIFDFDDDNLITESIPSSRDKEWYTAPAVRVFNPYPSYINLSDISWPRGYPLSEIQNTSTWAHLKSMPKRCVNDSNIGVIQSLANHDPDVDAIWRLTRQLPLTFTDNIHIMLQPRTMSPYNAQATLHYALWGLLLPVSVHGRVSDIWRSYITQRLMWDVGQTVGFVSPFVKQIRNSHDYKADFNSEIPLYVKTEALINILNNWNGKSDDLEGRMVELYIELFERDFLEYSDVVLTKKWIRTLKQIKYKFPPLS